MFLGKDGAHVFDHVVRVTFKIFTSDVGFLLVLVLEPLNELLLDLVAVVTFTLEEKNASLGVLRKPFLIRLFCLSNLVDGPPIVHKLAFLEQIDVFNVRLDGRRGGGL